MSANVKERPMRKFWKTKRSLPAVKWDARLQKPRWEFVNGIFETDDPEICKELIDMGYMEITHIDEEPPRKPPLDDLPDPDAARDPLIERLVAGKKQAGGA